MKKVELFCVGAAKSGTTSLYEFLLDNKVISRSTLKEPNYFCESSLLEQPFIGGLEEYSKNFSDNDKVWADFSTSYLYSRDAARNIYEYNKNARIIIVLRDPAQRALSLYNHQRRSLKESLPLQQAIEAEPQRILDKYPYGYHYCTSGLYVDQIKRYLDRFGEENVLILGFSSLTNEFERSVNQILGFMGGDAIDVEQSSLSHENATGLPKSIFIQNLIERNYPFKKTIKRMIGDGMLKKIKTMNVGEKVKPDKGVSLHFESFFDGQLSEIRDVLKDEEFNY